MKLLICASKLVGVHVRVRVCDNLSIWSSVFVLLHFNEGLSVFQVNLPCLPPFREILIGVVWMAMHRFVASVSVVVRVCVCVVCLWVDLWPEVVRMKAAPL